MESRYLFRGKRIDNGEWVEGYLSYPFCTEKGNESYYFYAKDSLGFFCRCVVDASTICQCTGLKDKNGKLIWENDIIKAWSQGTCAKGKIKQRIDGTWIMYPAWQKLEMWYLCPDNNGETTVEVIGNVFDNPKMMEV